MVPANEDLLLGSVLALELGEVPELDAALLANALQRIAGRSTYDGDKIFLLGLANALQETNGPYRLEFLGRSRGRPADEGFADEALIVGQIIERRLRSGVKQEAAVAEVMASQGLSRAKVLRLLKYFRTHFQPLFKMAQSKGRATGPSV